MKHLIRIILFTTILSTYILSNSCSHEIPRKGGTATLRLRNTSLQRKRKPPMNLTDINKFPDIGSMQVPSMWSEILLHYYNNSLTISCTYDLQMSLIFDGCYTNTHIVLSKVKTNTKISLNLPIDNYTITAFANSTKSFTKMTVAM